MLDFVFILLIFIEIALTTLCILKLIEFNKKIISLNTQVIVYGGLVLEINNKIKDIVKKINKVTSFLTNKKLLKAYQIVKLTIDVVQIILFINSIKHLKNANSLDYKNIKKIFMLEFLRRGIKKISNSI